MAESASILADIALKYLGVHDDASVRRFFADTTLGPEPASTPWCAAFINYVVKEARQTHPEIDAETHSAAALSWRHWGLEVPDGEQDRGDIVVFEWANGDHHVAVWLDQDGDKGLVQVVGGNQRNPHSGGPHEVTRTWEPLAAVIHFRRPRQYAA